MKVLALLSIFSLGASASSEFDSKFSAIWDNPDAKKVFGELPDEGKKEFCTSFFGYESKLGKPLLRSFFAGKCQNLSKEPPSKEVITGKDIHGIKGDLEGKALEKKKYEEERTAWEKRKADLAKFRSELKGIKEASVRSPEGKPKEIGKKEKTTQELFEKIFFLFEEINEKERVSQDKGRNKDYFEDFLKIFQEQEEILLELKKIGGAIDPEVRLSPEQWEEDYGQIWKDIYHDVQLSLSGPKSGLRDLGVHVPN